MIFEFSGSRPTSQFENPKLFEFSRVRLKLQLNFRRNPGFLHNRHVRRNRQILQKISSMRKLLTNRVVPAQNFLAKIDKFSQKSVSFRNKLQIFAKKSYFFAKIGICSQKSANFRQKSTYFRKNLHIFAKIGRFSQKSANFRKKNRQIFAKIGKFSQTSVNLGIPAHKPIQKSKNFRIFAYAPQTKSRKFRSSFRCHIKARPGAHGI